jgi:hypothetical protein
MSTVRPFNNERIIAHMKKYERRYFTDSEGDIMLRFTGEGIQFACFVMAKGENDEILAMLAFPEKEYDRSQWAACMDACNNWNSSHRWPATYLRISESDNRADVCCEFNVDLEQGVHQELLDDMINTFIAATIEFLKWMRDDRGL